MTPSAINSQNTDGDGNEVHSNQIDNLIGTIEQQNKAEEAHQSQEENDKQGIEMNSEIQQRLSSLT